MSPHFLSATALHVAFGGHPVLTDASVSLPTGQCLALLGANGSGKTTLLRTLAGSLRPLSGQVLVDGVPLDFGRAGLRAHRQRVQLVAQNPDDQLFAADVFRDVSFGPLNLGLDEAAVRDRVAQALAALAIEDLAERPIHELSFGQRKRVALAGALAMRPSAILLDEPTAGLDPHGVQELVAALDSLRRGNTTVMIATHDVDFALAFADSVAVLVQGQVRHGSAAELLSDPGLVEAARLRQPWVLEAAAGLGLDPSGIRDVAGLVAAAQAGVGVGSVGGVA